MKKVLLSLLLTVVFMLSACGTNVDNIEFESIELISVFEELKNNSARGEELYKNKYFEFCGLVSSIASDSFVVKSLHGETANCNIKDKALKEVILGLNTDDYIKVSGKITATLYSSIDVDVFKIEKPDVFSYDGFEFGMDINDLREKETKKSLTNGSMSGSEIPYIVDDSYIDEFGYNPDFVRYGFHSWKLSKISLTYSEVDLSFFNNVVSKLTTKYGNPENTNEDSKYTKRFFTDSVLITVYYYEDSNSAGVIFMNPAYYSLSNYLVK